MPELLFDGAAGEVTGSMHMLRVDDGWLALDCGLFQGRRSESEEKNRQWPVPPKEIKAVILSHAHIDHTGRLPRLVRDGFEGPVYCTPATRDLCAIMLPDSAHIQVEDIKYVNKRRAKKNLPPVDLLYEHRDAFAAVAMMHSIPYKHWFHVVPGVKARYREAGHMLGSAGVELAISDGNGGEKIVYFSGDIGRQDKPILRDPAAMRRADLREHLRRADQRECRRRQGADHADCQTHVRARRAGDHPGVFGRADADDRVLSARADESGKSAEAPGLRGQPVGGQRDRGLQAAPGVL